MTTDQKPMNGRVLACNSEIPAADFSVLDQAARNKLRRIDCGCKTNALSRKNDGRVDADHFTARCNKRPARVSRIQCRVRLYHVVEKASGLGSQRPAEG